MNVTIKTTFGEMTFDMTTENAMDLLRRATEYAQFHQPAPLVEKPWHLRKDTPAPSVCEDGKLSVDPAVSVMIDKGHDSKPAPKLKEAPKARVETLFGARAAWNKPETEATDNAAPASGVDHEIKPDEAERYKGFLLIKCDDCRDERSFFTKIPLMYHQCKCGHRTVLTGLVPMFARCKCGAEFKYRTNIDTHNVSIRCLKCGAPIDLELNRRATAYVTLGWQPAHR